MSTTQQEILDAVNNLSKSPWYGYNHDYTSILGGVTRNASGHVVGARVAQVFWRLEIPDNAEVVDSQGEERKVFKLIYLTDSGWRWHEFEGDTETVLQIIGKITHLIEMIQSEPRKMRKEYLGNKEKKRNKRSSVK